MNAMLCSAPAGKDRQLIAAITPDGSKLVVATSGSTSVAIMNTSTNAVSYVSGFSTTSAVAITADGLEALVANSVSSGSLGVITLASNTLASTVTGLGRTPAALAITPAGTQAITANSGGTNASAVYTKKNDSQLSYDGMGRYEQINETGTLPSGVAPLSYFVWCGNQLCETRTDLTDMDNAKQFFSLGQMNYNASGSGTAYFYAKDALGSIRDVTNSSSSIVGELVYDTFGRSSILQSSTLPDFQYAGYYPHQRSALTLTLHRAYLSSIGRFINSKPGGFDW